MKLLVWIIFYSFCSLSINAVLAFEDQFNQSLETWKNIKPKRYTYTSSFESWLGYGQKTEITVACDKVIRRAFESWEDYLTPESDIRIIDSWVEDKRNTIGTHEGGFPPLTMEEIYEKCKTTLAMDTLTHDIYFTTDTRGILKQCQYYPHGCSDDCMFGIIIDELIFERLQPVTKSSKSDKC